MLFEIGYHVHVYMCTPQGGLSMDGPSRKTVIQRNKFLHERSGKAYWKSTLFKLLVKG